jgi:hypothetical protein
VPSGCTPSKQRCYIPQKLCRQTIKVKTRDYSVAQKRCKLKQWRMLHLLLCCVAAVDLDDVMYQQANDNAFTVSRGKLLVFSRRILLDAAL